MVNAHVVVIVHVNQLTHQITPLSLWRGVGGEAPRQLVNFLTKKRMRFQEETAFFLYCPLLEKPVAKDAGDISGEGYRRDMTHIPAKGDLLKSHDDYTCGRADDEH